MALRSSRLDAGTTADPDATASIEDALRAIEAECAVALGSDAVVVAACDRLRAARAAWWIPAHPPVLATLRALLSTRTGPIAQALFQLIEDLARDAADPLPFVRAMLSARDTSLAKRGIDVAATLSRSGRLRGSRALLSEVAAVADESSPLLSKELLEPLGEWLRGVCASEVLTACYLERGDGRLSRLAARILDGESRPARHTVKRVLGNEPAEFFVPYLDYTRATHLDLLDLAAPANSSQPGSVPVCLASLRHAEQICGPALLRHAIAAIGWQHVNRGLEVRPIAGLSVGGGLPLFFAPEDLAPFEHCPDARRVGHYFVLIGHGEASAASATSGAADERVARFRGANLVHAEALAELLDLSPLSRGRVERLIGMTDRLTADFIAVFEEAAEECASIGRTYADLRQRITAALAASNDTEVIRLVQPFEDPATVADIRSLHGLKRYLHQRSLKLAFRIVQGSRGTNRTATPLVATTDDVIATGRAIEYVDFEPAEEAPGGAPYAVQVVIGAFAHQMLHGVTTLPSVRVYCYGNEVQYFVAFRNHPVFIRVDFSPPAGGGMIDLEYYGVSKYELSQHPNLGLDAIRACFERLDFAVTIENTRIHARYDKERARDTADLCARAEALFRLVPYLMDLDWQLGALDVSPDARREIERAWADVLARWGVLPLEQITTADRRRVLLGYEYGPIGPIEIPWRGDGPYRDRVTTASSKSFAAEVTRVLEERGLAGNLALAAEDIAQIPFERKVVRILRQAPQSGGCRPHAAEYLAGLLIGGDAALADGGRLALLVGQLERLLRFSSVGSINGYDVQRAELAVPGEVLALTVLRDDSDIGRIACFAREAPADVPSTDAKAFTALLRRRNFPLATDAQRDSDPPQALRVLFRSRSRRTPPVALRGEFLIAGTRAAAGRAVGLARFRSGRSTPADVEGAIFITPRLSPDDGPYLVRAAGVVATGGGVLCHAGLLAAQFERPALVVSGTWHDTRGLDRHLRIETAEHETLMTKVGEHDVIIKRQVRAGVREIRDGDLVELAADEGVARVYGQDRESLALHDSLAQLATASARVATAADPAEVLAERGRQLRAVHLLERLLTAIDRPALIAHAVRELLVGRGDGVRATAPREHAALVRALLENRAAGVPARACATEVYSSMSRTLAAAYASATREVPAARDLAGVLLPRLAAIRDAGAMASTRAALEASGVDVDPSVSVDLDALDRLAAARVRDLRSQMVEELNGLARGGRSDARLGRVIEAIDMCNTLVASDPAVEPQHAGVRRAAAEHEGRSVARARGLTVLSAGAGGLELRPIIGGKAANLAAVAQLAGPATVPEWFALTAGALDSVLAANAPAGGSMRAAIERASAPGTGDERQRAHTIAALFEAVDLPRDLVNHIVDAYQQLEIAAGPNAPRAAGGNLLVAVRSSAADEDTSSATRAGEFDTFLCVAGTDDLIRHVRRAWAGFWSARAIHGRETLGQSRPGGCGVIVQRMVAARAAGVVQTINAADRRAGEIVINAAFGLGAGVVSGVVAADHIIVSKPGLLEREGPLRFRYATADKRQQVVFDARAGGGTVITDTLYHQRMRPALEYAQLAELARAAARLERAYAYALDIEFAFDSAQLWILQARPVPAWFAAIRETRESYPLDRSSDGPRSGR